LDNKVIDIIDDRL